VTKTISLNLRVQYVPPVAQRKRHVLILLRDSNHRYILGKKNIYPSGIFRMVGGGVEKNEAYRPAAARELHEELKVFIPPRKLQELVKVIAHITDATQKVWIFTTVIFFYQLEGQGILPSDDLDGVVRLTEAEVEQLIHHFNQLSREVLPQENFSWYDYGQLYGTIHRIAFEELKKKERLPSIEV
jgi:ADP-ribose pyrophosphatase YjhB (NUDIX family)